MNSQWTSAVVLATGQTMPFTGAWSDTAQSRNTLIIAYVSGSGLAPSVINVQTQASSYLGMYHPSFKAGAANDGVPLYSFTGITTGYQSPALLTSPLPNIRVIASGGSGQLFAYALLQN